MSNIKTLISEIYILNFFQKCKLIEKVENTDSRSDLKEIEVILLKIRKLQDSLLEKAMKNNANKEKIGTLKNLLSKSKMSNIKLLEKSDEENKNLDDLLDKLWNE